MVEWSLKRKLIRAVMRCRIPIALALFVAAGAAAAADGRIPLNQALADAQGFPLTIEAPGSYVLTSDLVVGSASVTAIDVDADWVAIDLNGFAIRGPGSPGSGRGVDATGQSGLMLRDGRIQGVGDAGIVAGARATLVDLEVRGCGGDGVVGGRDLLVEGSRITGNGGSGVACGRGCVSHASTLQGNGSRGVIASALPEATLLLAGGLVTGNGSNGVEVAGSSLVTSTTARANLNGFAVGFGGQTSAGASLVVASSASDHPGGVGVSGAEATLLVDVSLRDNQTGFTNSELAHQSTITGGQIRALDSPVVAQCTFDALGQFDTLISLGVNACGGGICP